MKLLILGANGMFGNGLVGQLSDQFELAYTFRNYRVQENKKTKFYNHVDAFDLSTILRVINDFKPNVVINAIGVVKQKKDISVTTSIYLNSEFPYHLSHICELSNAKLILLSTDCVFNGGKGNYTELDLPDATDIYGRSKVLGEITESLNVLTIRSSTIGFELESNKGLLEWFLSQKGIVHGYKNAIYSGFPVSDFSNALALIIKKFPSLSGLYHISSDPISKFELLYTLKEMLNLDYINLNENIEFKCDRSLNSNKFKSVTGYSPPSWNEMLQKLALQIRERKGIINV